MKRILFIISLLSTHLLYAGNGDGSRTVGNGGDVIKCPANGKYSYQILDWYEGSELRALNLSLGEAHLSIEEKLQIALNRLSRLSPERAKRYEAHLKTFFSETRWLTNSVLINIPDSDHIMLPHPDCKILQIANQSTPILSIDKRYIIDKNLWDQLDNDNKATLLLHEVIYREGLEYGHKASVSTRYLNSLILSTEIDSFTIPEFSEILSKLGFKYNMVQGIDIQLEGASFYGDGQLKSATVKDGATLRFGENIIPLKDTIHFYTNGVIQEFTPSEESEFFYESNKYHAFPFPIKFYPNGRLKSLLLSKSTPINFLSHQLFIKGSVKFYENGFLKNAIIEKGNVAVPGLKPAPIKVKDDIEFHPNGNVSKLKGESTFAIPYYKEKSVWRGLLHLNDEGQVLSAYLVEPLEIRLQGEKLTLNPFQAISFWEKTGKLQYLQVPKDLTLLSQKNNLVRVEARSFIKLTEDERLIEN